jgi:hypothetical protein
MGEERVPTWLLQTGDVIRVRRHHDSRCGECRSGWETNAVVTEKPASVGGRVAIRWANIRLPGTRPATGISVVRPDEPALRIGHFW